VLLVFASHPYEPDEYLTDDEEFLEARKPQPAGD
jgi:hypothetical protein